MTNKSESPRWRQLQLCPTFDRCAVMTLLLLLLYSSKVWYVHIPVTALCVSAFVFRGPRRRPEFWFAVGAATLLGTYHDRFSADNHKYLLGYWCLALFCALLDGDPRRNLARTARLLIGLSFLFAAGWKALSADFLDGAFFHHALLSDERFAGLARTIGGLSDADQRFNRAAMEALASHDSTLEIVALRSTPAVAELATFLTWWTIAIEAAIAAAFLWPAKNEGRRVGDALLIAFVLSTYAVAPVLGFGWLLVIMGVAQSPARPGFVPLLYVLCFVVLQLYRLPWTAFVGEG
ncbi:hypothetical protein [Nannocystis punicea]|uniref:Uncharacterized protein n=1 Tax=Nannocystis punicea TaxID=2995304 RepID=A0ABY7GUM7_9BACT|nr:hypothetical protein [Nannocystis poenicansa]WAS90638.1 hypothetical protein O0S08_31000 [Nannocystis poenicansa]